MKFISIPFESKLKTLDLSLKKGKLSKVQVKYPLQNIKMN
jgi:hypothetical protein